MRRPLPPVVLFAAIVLLGAAHLWLPLAQPIDSPLRLAGLVAVGLGVYLNLAADALLKRNHTTVKPFEKSTSLVASGAYRVSRHPMYLGFVLILGGIAILLGSASPWIVVAAFALLIDRTYVRVEESMLRAQFGEEWNAYAKVVRRWI
jgi:protein-S-isoprenylcysteine O-methyltransferase Ste14